MPSITYIEDNDRRDGAERRASAPPKSAPEPPARYDARSGQPVLPGGPPSGNGESDFSSARRLTTISQVMALVSLLIGGVVLSGAALVVASVASRRARDGADGRGGDQTAWQALRRSATIAVVMSALALAANIAALVVLYPMLMEAIQSGEYSSLLAGASGPASPSSGSSTWG